MKFSESKCRVLELGWNNPVHQYRLGAGKQLYREGSRSACEQQSALHPCSAKTISILDCFSKGVASRSREVIHYPLLYSWDLCDSNFGLSNSRVEGQQGEEGLEHMTAKTGWESKVSLTLRREGSVEFLLLSTAPWWVNMEKMELYSSQRCTVEEGDTVESGKFQLSVGE